MTEQTSLDLLAALVLEDGQRWGEIAADFQWEDAGALFSDDGPLWHFYTRPRGGSKTTDLAGVSLVWLATVAAPGARGFVFAGSQDQAALLLDAASGLVDRTPELRDVIEIQAKKILHRRSGATMEVRAADGDHAFGLRPSFVVCDEAAQWAETRRARRLWVAIVSSLAKVPNCRFVCLSSAGEPGHWSHKVLQDALKAPDRWDVHEVPGPLPWVDVEDLKAQGLRDSEFARLHLNQWVQSENRLVTFEDLEAATVLNGELDPQPGIHYFITCDLGLTHDATVVAVGHSESISSEPGAPMRVVVDSLKKWQGKRLAPVQLADIESYLVLTSQRYNRARIMADPWQAAGLLQRLKTQGVQAEQFPFTTTSVGRLGQSLHLALKNHLILLPRDDDLIAELSRVRLVETGVGTARLDHDSSGHDDMAVVCAMLTAELIGNVKPRQAAEWLESLAPMHSCGQPNRREAQASVRNAMRHWSPRNRSLSQSLL